MTRKNSPGDAERVRAPACAGRFYPGTAAELRAAVEGFLNAGNRGSGLAPKALVAPHAGYMYSGAIAGSAYGTLYGRAGHVRRVILLGPTHHGARHALNLSSAAAFATPLGEVQCGAEATDRLARLPGVGVDDGAHRPEHCLEVQLPFLQVVLGMFEVVPVLVGTARDEQVSEALAALWGGAETLVVVSSDLSHYHDYRTAQALDSVTAAAITQLEGGRLTGTDACGSHAIRGLLHRARALELHATLLDLRNSGDTAGGRDRVVGYGAFSFAATPSAAAA